MIRRWFQNETWVGRLGVGCGLGMLLVALLVLLFEAVVTSSPPVAQDDVPLADNGRFAPFPTPTISSETTTDDLATAEIATVIRVIDGDTIEVELNGRSERVRYIGMDTPERGQPFFSEATAANAALVAEQQVRMVKDISERDRYSRLLRYIYLADGTFVNAELVRQGMARGATFPPDVRHQALFLQLEQEARQNGVGLWGGSAVLPTAVALPTADALLTVAVLPTPTPLPAATVESPLPSVVIATVLFDGVVRQVESDEYAVVVNEGETAVDVTGWRLYAGDAGQEFYFPPMALAPGQSCRVYTNEVHPEFCGLTFGYGRAIWNNRGECGTLFNREGVVVSTYCY